MGDLKSKVSKGVKRYMRRRGYRRLAVDEPRSKRQRWSWKIKIKIKLRFNPKKWISRVHDAYVRMMMRVADIRVVSSGALAGYGGGGAIGQFGMRPMKEYDEKMIIQMYNAMVARHAMALEVTSPRVACSQ